MTIAMSTAGRALVQRLPFAPTPEVVLHVENALLDHAIARFPSRVKDPASAVEHLLGTKATTVLRNDPCTINLVPVQDRWLATVTHYLVADFSRTQAIMLASLCERYTLHEFERAISAASAAKVFTIPYLAAVLGSQGSQVVAEERRDETIREAVDASAPLVLPPNRFPGALAQAMAEHERADEIEQVLKENGIA